MSEPNNLQTRADLIIRPEINPKEEDNVRPGDFTQRIIAACYRSIQL